MSEEEKRELWKGIGFIQGYYEGQRDEIRNQIEYMKMTPEQQFNHNMIGLFNLQAALDKKKP